MEYILKWHVSQRFTKVILLTVYDIKVTLHLDSSQEQNVQASTESNQEIEMALDNIPSFIKSLLIITRVQCRFKLLLLGIDSNKFFMILFNYINISGTPVLQQAFSMLTDNFKEVIILQNNHLVFHYRRHLISTLVHQLSLSNNLTGSRGGIYIHICNIFKQGFDLGV